MSSMQTDTDITADPGTADCQECHVPNSPFMLEAGRYLCIEKCQPRHRVQLERQHRIAAEREAAKLRWETERRAWEAAQQERARLKELDPEIQRRIVEAMGLEGAYGVATPEVISVYVDAEHTELITFDALDRLHRTFGTRSISLKSHRGTYYSDVTPGEPDSVSIEITGWVLALEHADRDE